MSVWISEEKSAGGQAQTPPYADGLSNNLAQRRQVLSHQGYLLNQIPDRLEFLPRKHGQKPPLPFSWLCFIRSIKGTVAKNGWGRKKPGPDSSLGGNLEEAFHKSHLPLNVTFACSFNLPSPHHLHRLITLDCSTCCLKTEEPESGINTPFDEPMILLDEVVEIFTLSHLSAVGRVPSPSIGRPLADRLASYRRSSLAEMSAMRP